MNTAAAHTTTALKQHHPSGKLPLATAGTQVNKGLEHKRSIAITATATNHCKQSHFETKEKLPIPEDDCKQPRPKHLFIIGGPRSKQLKMLAQKLLPCFGETNSDGWQVIEFTPTDQIPTADAFTVWELWLKENKVTKNDRIIWDNFTAAILMEESGMGQYSFPHFSPNIPNVKVGTKFGDIVSSKHLQLSS